MTSPYSQDLTIQENVRAVTTITDDVQTVIGRAQFPATVNSVQYIPAGTQAGAATNNRTLTLYNRGSSGGTVAIATLTLASGTDLTDNTPKTITLATGNSLSLSVGDILEWESLHNASGLADPGGLVVVQMAMRS